MKGLNRPKWALQYRLIMNYLKILLTTIKREIKGTMMSDPYFAVKLYRKKGVKFGDFVRLYNVSIDARRPFLVEIGNNVIMTNCRILTHDASTSIATGYTKVGKVKIGNNVFVGAGVIILPNVEIGNNVVVGAGTVVSKSIPDNSVVVGSPQKKIGTFDDFVQRNSNYISNRPKFSSDKLSLEQIDSMKQLLEDGIGFVESPDSVYFKK